MIRLRQDFGATLGRPIWLILAVLMLAGVARATHTCTTCYVDYENGCDTNDGTTSTQTSGSCPTGGSGPWKHAPGMLGKAPGNVSTGDGATGNAASQVPVAGDKYILKGGVVWPNTVFPWAAPGNGTSSSSTYGCAGSGCIYWGNAIGAGLPAWNKGIVNSVTLTRDLGGWNPASPPTITLTGGGGSGATATLSVMPAAQTDPLLAGFIYHTAVASQGSGYTSAPTCSISGSGGFATCAADIDRPVMDLGGTLGTPIDWAIQSGGTNAIPYCPGAGSYTIVYGIECRNLMAQASTSSTIVYGLVGGGAHSTVSHNYLHGFFVDCAYPFGAAYAGPNCPATLTTITTEAVSVYYTYDEAAYNVIENGDSFFLANSTSVSENIGPFVNAAGEMGAWGISTGSQQPGPVSIHNNIIYGGGWPIRIQTNNVSGDNNPHLVYGNEIWGTTYSVNPSAHINRRYTQMPCNGCNPGLGPAILVSYNNIDHNHQSSSSNQQQCTTGAVFYFFNEVIWGTGTGTPPYGVNTVSPATGGCTAYFFNDTLYNPTSSYLCLNSNSTATDATTIVMQNLHCITGPSVVNPFWGSGYTNITYEDYAGSSVAANVQAASVVQGISTANAQGYTLLNLYAPTSASGATVPFATGGNSANLSALCSGYLVPLCSDINGVPRGPNWQAGAYVSQSLLPPVSSRTLQ